MPEHANDIAKQSFDDLLPARMAQRGEEIGVRKANLDFFNMFALAILAGAFISVGAVFATIVLTTPGMAVPWGWGRLLAGTVFSLGLILVIVGGAELFTGNNLIIMAWASRHLSTRKLLRNWGIVYLGNLTGAVATAVLLYLSKQYEMANGSVGLTALNIGLGKVQLDFFQAIILGVLCNALVCLAVWLTYSARTTIGRIVAIIPPISAFVAAGFEHCIANMYFVPYAILIRAGAPQSFWDKIGVDSGAFFELNWGSFLVNNLIPVTIGNIIGGVFLVGAAYWVIYLRKK